MIEDTPEQARRAEARTGSGRFASTSDEAKARFGIWHDRDPYPEIKPALLNSADFSDYVATTGMIHPFDPSKLKPASYALSLGGKVIWWDRGTRKRRVVEIKQGVEFVLQQNSIAFVTLEPLLQVPDYLALRFNLKIANVYRGLLLGTGPLVDPGFVGRLSFPLHNLTTNDYRFRCGDDMIWVEATKLSPQESWHREEEPTAPTRAGVYAKFPPHGPRRDVEDYIDESIRHGHVWSSISEALRMADKAATRARNFSVLGIIALLGLGVSVMGVAYAVVADRQSLPRLEDQQKNEAEIASLTSQIQALRTRLKALESRTTQVERAARTKP